MKTRLQELRKAAGFKSAKAFSDYYGINLNTYTGYEQGKPYSLEQAWAFADEFEVTIDELAGREWPRPEYADPLQAEMNEIYGYLDDPNRKAAVGAIKGIAANQAREKTAGDGPDPDAVRA